METEGKYIVTSFTNSMDLEVKETENFENLNDSYQETGLDDFDLKLIALVKNYPGVYDKNHHQFKQRSLLWKVIGKKLNTSSQTCFNRFKNLRERWARQTRLGKSTWPYMQYLEFMRPYIQRRRKLAKKYIEDKCCNINAIDHNYTDTATAEGNDMKMESIFILSDEKPSETIELSSSQPSNSDVQSQIDSIDSVIARLVKLIEIQSVDDSAAHFGRLIASYLREFDPSVVPAVEIAILEVISSYKTGNKT